MSFIIIIPARYDSTRLPGKLVKTINGKTILEYVYACAKASDATQVIIATDDQRIVEIAQGFGADVCLTAASHTSGTQRLAEVVEQRQISPDAIIVNLQGDEPLMPAECINQVAQLLQNDPAAVVATLCSPLESAADVFDSSIVKVVSDKHQHALYFSRAAIPWHREDFPTPPLSQTSVEYVRRHIGIYAYRAAYVQRYVQLDPSPLEQIESLEQLRVLWHGDKIAIAQAVKVPGPGVDTEEDLQQVAALLTH